MRLAVPIHLKTRNFWVLVYLACLLSLSACVRPGPGNPDLPEITGGNSPTQESGTSADGESSGIDSNPSTPLAGGLGAIPEFAGTPTPDVAHYSAVTTQNSHLTHTVAAGETLGILAQRYNTTIEELIALNNLINPDIIQVGQAIIVPGTGEPSLTSPDFKILPDSELVYGPAAADFDVRALAEKLDSYLLRYEEEVEGQRLDGSAIVQLVADRHSVNPRLLVAVLEHQTGWITRRTADTQVSQISQASSNQPSLYGQLSWAANLLNLGYYGRSEGGLRNFTIGPSTVVFFSPTINDATAGVQLLFGSMRDVVYDDWVGEVGPDGFFETYNRLFGNPFGYTVEPLLPDDLKSPDFALPWPPGETWYYTSGPHGSWNSGSAWGALDFAPPSDQLGCVPSDNWVTAMSDGIVTRSGNGAVVVDMDGDGYAGTGWAITYMHLESRDRIPVGQTVETGDRLGHPSCEGGFSNGTHVHIVRSYNGRWISADTEQPFAMSGWVSQGAGTEYNGYLVRDGVTKEACACRDESNAITHEP